MLQIKNIPLLACTSVFLCGLMLIVGALAALFEDALIVRIYGGLVAAMAVVVGTGIGRRVWPRHPAALAGTSDVTRSPTA
jgi:hypothetical protein